MKVMIVEDEILVRLGLRKSIPWSTLGMELVCEAKDGTEACDMFTRHLPDIVLVDIELPKMDGLKFIRFAKTHQSRTHFIVLTCHQDMKYMREAIKLQVTDFILKSTLDMKELCDILQNIALEWKRDTLTHKGGLPEAAAVRAEDFYRNWLSGTLRDPGVIQQQIAQMSGTGPMERFIACVMQLDPRSHEHIKLSDADIRSMGQRIGRMLIQRHEGLVLGSVEEMHIHRWHFIVSERLTVSEMNEWMDTVKQNIGITFSVGRSAPFVHPHEWQAYDHKAVELLQHQYYDAEGRLYAGEGVLGERLSEPVHAAKKQICDMIGSLRFAEARVILTDLQEELQREPRLHPHIVKNMFTEFLFRMWSTCEELAAVNPNANHQLVDQIYATQKLDQTVSLLLADMERAERQLEMTHSVNDKTKVIVLVKQYIKNHLQQEISLQEIADTFNINRSYLSRLFREVSDMSFTEFVLFEKTELAIVMMHSGKSLTEISEKLGYLNLSSFTRMFKKVRGASPSMFVSSGLQR
ncbi:response regulator transcription factor [Paenibacillus vandeheii]